MWLNAEQERQQAQDYMQNSNNGMPSGVNLYNNLAYLGNSADSYVNAYNQAQAWAREDMIRKEGYEREDTAYTRLFDELKKNGINPALLISGASPMVGSSGGNSAASFKTSNYDINEKTQAANSAKVVGAILAALAMVAAAAL